MKLMFVVFVIVACCLSIDGLAKDRLLKQKDAVRLIDSILAKEFLYRNAYADPFPGKDNPEFFVFDILTGDARVPSVHVDTIDINRQTGETWIVRGVDCYRYIHSLERTHLTLCLSLVTSRVLASTSIDVCEVQRGDSATVGKLVSFKGRVSSDGMHYTVVLPDACPDKRFALKGELKSDDAGGLIMRALWGVGEPGTVHKDVWIDIDAVVEGLDDGRHALRVKRLNHMTIEYPKKESGP